MIITIFSYCCIQNIITLYGICYILYHNINIKYHTVCHQLIKMCLTRRHSNSHSDASNHPTTKFGYAEVLPETRETLGNSNFNSNNCAAVKYPRFSSSLEIWMARKRVFTAVARLRGEKVAANFPTGEPGWSYHRQWTKPSAVRRYLMTSWRMAPNPLE